MVKKRHRTGHARRRRRMLLLAGVLLALSTPAAEALAARKAPVVVLDAGHGGRFPGAVNCRYAFAGKSCMLESDVNLAIAKKANKILQKWGFRTRLTRRRDTTVNRPLHDIATWNATSGGGYSFYKDGRADVHDDLQARVNVANCGRPGRSCKIGHRKRADAFVSVHNNACGGCGAGGTITFYWRSDAARLASLIQREVTKRTRGVTRGTRTAIFYVVHWTRMPSVLLEATFLDNNAEARLLLRRPFRAKIARGVAAGTARFLCSAEGTGRADTLIGTRGDDVICAFGGNDTIEPRSGRDVVVAGASLDTVAYSRAPQGVNVNLATRSASGWASDGLFGVENVTGSDFDDVLTGSFKANSLSGLGGADSLFGMGGADDLRGGEGDDSLNGGPGEDLCDQGPGTGDIVACEKP